MSETDVVLIKKFEESVFEEKVCENNSLTLDIIAKRLNTNRSYLSGAINKKYGLNYSGFMNKFRVDAARLKLASRDFDKYSIEGIARNVGFNSTSTFNLSFKKITGLTPSYFRKEAQGQTNL